MSRATRKKGTLTHCANGHEYTPENTYWNPTTGRPFCRTCNRERQLAYRQGTKIKSKGPKTHCKHGHAYTAVNTLVRPGTNHRLCRKCVWGRRYEKKVKPPPFERFVALISESPSGCWLWQGGKQGSGYGVFNFHEDRSAGQLAHRHAYEIWRGPIPDGLQIDHLCSTRNCVNPWHLEPVTMLENIRRGWTRLDRIWGQSHCPQGHEFTEENTYWRPGGGRRCRQCQRGWNTQWQRRRTGAA